MGRDELILLVFFLLLYVAMLVLLSIRIRRLSYFGKRNKVPKVLYLSIFCFIVLRIIGIIIILGSGDSIDDRVAYLFIELPHAFSIVPFILLGIIKLDKTYEGHISSHISKTFIADTEKKSRLRSFKPAIIAYVSILFVGFSALICLYLADFVDGIVLDTYLGCFDITVSVAILVLAVILHTKFSGVPTKSEKWAKILKKIRAVTIFWIAGRTLRSVYDIISFVSTSSQSSNIFNGSINLTNFILGLISVFVTEILNIVLTIDYSFFSIFVQEKQEKIKTPQSDTQMRRTAVRMSMVSMNPYIEDQEIEILEEVVGRVSGLGKMYKAKYLNRDIAYRKILISNVSTYVTEEIHEEVESYKKLCIPGIVRVEAVVLNQTIVGFAYRLYPNSLYNTLHIAKTQLDFKKKVNILGKIAEVLSDIHIEGKVHGHLTSHNVMLNGDEVLISDLGFHKLKKYIGIKNNYSYKSAWSSPEMLKDPRLTPGNLHCSCDVYSFGMICWEVFTENEPFSQFSIEQVRKKVVEEGSRPKIPTELNENLARVIQSCFNEDFNTRPDMNMLTGLLNY